METPYITVEELKRKRDHHDLLVLLDVRWDRELEIASILGAIHIPMDQIAGRLGELDTSKEIIVVCHTGNRSGRVTSFLIAHGFPKARNLQGGIHAWSQRIDPSVPLY